MKRIVVLAMILAGFEVNAQTNKQPVIVESSPTIFNYSYNAYYDYADQGTRMYINNSQFYNKDNQITNSVPVGNGNYVKPGNSTPINRDMYQGAEQPSGTIYSGPIPVRSYGESSEGAEDYRR
ncbi:MAG TPA: hypothetical protein VL093_09385 [Flavipsychrobacter sp.]|jgi:hypothetical protein|nr:hypothetical protein [Flavipsychrobacter sp.]